MMNRKLRALTAGSLLTALVVAGVTAYPALAHEGGSDFWFGSDWQFDRTKSQQRTRELARLEEVILRRTALRSETVADLIDGRISAEEAALRFAALNHMGPVTLERVREMYPGATDEERVWRQLVAHVRANPHPRAAAVAEETACRLAYPAATP